MGRPLSEQELLRLRIQTVAPWKRAVFVSIGFLIGAVAFACDLAAAPMWISVPSGLAAVSIGAAGALGSRGYLDAELKKLRHEGPSTVLGAIGNGLM